MNHQNQDVLSLLIVAQPGRVRDSLEVLLNSIPAMAHVRATDDIVLNEQTVENNRLSSLIVLDVNLTGERAWFLLKQLKEKQLTSKCIVLVESRKQQYRAKALGADAVLLKGFTASEIFVTIEKLGQPEHRYQQGRCYEPYD